MPVCFSLRHSAKWKYINWFIVGSRISAVNKTLCTYRECKEQGMWVARAKEISKANHFREEATLFTCLLKQFGNERALSKGKLAHAQILKGGYGQVTFFMNNLMEMYGKCGSLGDACFAFGRTFETNVYSWNILIVLYGQCGEIVWAHMLFERMPQRDAVSWNAIISACTENGCHDQALDLYLRMKQDGVEPTKVTFITIVAACSTLASLSEGRLIHANLFILDFQFDIAVGNSLVNMYDNCESLHEAWWVFDGMHKQDVISLTSMITAYAHHAHTEEAIELFKQMQTDSEDIKPNVITFVSALSACATKIYLSEGKRIHACIVKFGPDINVTIGAALVTMYGKCKSLSDAIVTFNEIPEHNVISWTAIISACSELGCVQEALKLFRKMHLCNVVPNEVTFLSLLDACATCAALAEGKWIHALIIERGLDLNVVIGTAIINMYGRCVSLHNALKVFKKFGKWNLVMWTAMLVVQAQSGSLQDACALFNKMPERNIVSWNVMIAAYAQHGYGKQACRLLREMQLQGIMPTDLTFISVLFACSHTGLIDTSSHCFTSFSHDHCIITMPEHYNCIIDLFGRLGWLDEQVDLISNMPFQASVTSWTSLLGACKLYFNLERAEHISASLFDLDVDESGPYVLLSSIYQESLGKA